jgi:hypothetical protein
LERSTRAYHFFFRVLPYHLVLDVVTVYINTSIIAVQTYGFCFETDYEYAKSLVPLEGFDMKKHGLEPEDFLEHKIKNRDGR